VVAWLTAGVSLQQPVRVDVVVVGAGQAGLSTAFHLVRRGLVPLDGPGGAGARTFVVLDADEGPGGAWQHRWRTLTMGGTNRVHELPGTPLGDVDLDEPAADAVPRYFARYERDHALHVRRPVRVLAVRDADGGGGGDIDHSTDDARGRSGDLLVETDSGSYLAGAVVSATGTWTRPFWPRYPGVGTFAGRQLHTHDFRGAAELAGRRVVVVGGGISAIQHLMDLAPVATTLWVTRREPTWREGTFDRRAGHDAVALVEERTRAGLPPQSVVSVTGLPLTDEVRAARESGVLRRFPMFTAVDGDDVVWSPPSVLDVPGVPALVRVPAGARTQDGAVRWRADVILWATGFRSALDHLAPLRLREPGGGLLMDRTTAVRDPRVQLVGYGPSASTIGANRAGRDAARGALAALDRRLSLVE